MAERQVVQLEACGHSRDALLVHRLLELLEALAQVSHAWPELARLHLALRHAGDDGARGQLSHVELEALAITMLVIDPLPVHRRVGAEDVLDHVDGDVSRIDTMWMSAAAEIDGKFEAGVVVLWHGGGVGKGAFAEFLALDADSGENCALQTTDEAFQ